MERSAVSATLRLDEVLQEGTKELADAGVPTAAQDAQLLLLRVAGINRATLIAHPERILSADRLTRYRQLIARRRRHEPIQYITGEREFYGLTFKVTPEVLIPRPETEHLVEAALERIPLNVEVRIADAGTGSGAIAVALAVARPLAKFIAIDISPGALQIAQQNASAHQVAERIEFLEANLLEGVAASFDMIVSNPPYIASGERETLDAEVREFEPAAALFAGPTGVEIYERLVPQAAKVLRPGGWLLMEIGAGQQLQLSQLLKDWSNVSFIPDLQGIPRVAVAQRPKRLSA